MIKRMNKKKVAMTIASCGLVAALGVSGLSLAYLTDSEQATNRFTVEGDLDIELEEPNYPGNGSDEVKRVTPNKEIPKDPLVKNTGMNPEIVFLKVTVPVDTITPVADDGTKGTRGLNELFWLKDATDTAGTHANKFDSNWIELGAAALAANTKESTINNAGAATALTSNPASYPAGTVERTYVFGYNAALLPGASTTNLFDKVQLRNMLEHDLGEGQVENIKLEAYAIQSQDILEGDTDLADTLNAINLGKIYDRYVAQGTYGKGAEAVAADVATTKEYTNPATAANGLDEDGKKYVDNNYNKNIPEAHINNEKDIYDNGAQASGTNLENVTKTSPDGTNPDADPYNG